MSFAAFGPGVLIVTRTDVTPGIAVNIGYAQEFSLEAAGTTKQLYGQKQYPLAAARSTVKASGKFKAATISGLAWNNAFYGMSGLTAGAGMNWGIDSTYSVPASTAYTVTVGSSTTFDADLGIKYSTSGLPLQRVAGGSEDSGKYSVSGNVYTFAAADAGAALKITYAYTNMTGQTLAITNQLIGTTPTFQLDYYTNLNQPTAKPFIVRVFAAVGSKHSMPFKMDDFMLPEFEFDLYADASDRVYNLYFPEAS